MRLLRDMILWGAVVEIPTALARFGLGLESTRDTAGTVGKLTLGLRIHHGYVGILLLLAGWWLSSSSRYREGLLILGGALTLSDAFHHFVLLWLVTGSPQFDFFYPPS